jgi:hypothetical protein
MLKSMMFRAIMALAEMIREPPGGKAQAGSKMQRSVSTLWTQAEWGREGGEEE